jgi:hypothetical protein
MKIIQNSQRKSIQWSTLSTIGLRWLVFEDVKGVWYTIICWVNFTRYCCHFSPILACVILQKYQKNSKERDHIKNSTILSDDNLLGATTSIKSPNLKLHPFSFLFGENEEHEKIGLYQRLLHSRSQELHHLVDNRLWNLPELHVVWYHRTHHCDL